jgi:hypothetical protein
MPHIVRELAEALHHIHNLGITHRDLKPQNVLVRALEPVLDLVLTDFGVAREQFQETQFTAIKATFAWAAPEVHEGVQKAPVDWWALGAIIFELLTGRHPLAGPDGQLLPDVQIRPIVMRGLYTTDQLGSSRWRDLVDGLLAHNPDQRWGYAQVNAWLDGSDPPVHRTVPLTSAAGVQAPMIAAPVGLKFVFDGHPVASGAELLGLMRQHWPKTSALLTGRIDPLLAEWLGTIPEGSRALQEMRLENTAGARFVRLQAALDPAGPVSFLGRTLDDANLADGIGQAMKWRPDDQPDGTEPRPDGQLDAAPGEPPPALTPSEQAIEWLRAIRDERAMRALAGLERVDRTLGERLGAADQRLAEWHQQTRRIHRSVPDDQLARLVEQRDRALTGQLFTIALGARPAESLIQTLRQAVERRDTTGALWLEGLAARFAAMSGQALTDELGGLAAVAVLTEAVTTDNAARDRQAAAEREAREATAQAEMAQTELEMAATRRRHVAGQVLGRLRWRGTIALGYAVVGGWALAKNGSFTGGVFSEAPVPLAIALLAVVLTTGVDWLLENPAGILRAAAATAGLTTAGLIWLDGMNGTYLSRVAVWVAPLIWATAWIIGDVLSFAVRGLTSGRPSTDLEHQASPGEREIETARRVARAFRRAGLARAWAWVPVGAALATALAGLFFPACGRDCAPTYRWLSNSAVVGSPMPFDLPLLSTNGWALGAVALVAWWAQLATRPLMRVHWRSGWAVFWIGLGLALVVLAAGSDSLAALPTHWLDRLLGLLG